MVARTRMARAARRGVLGRVIAECHSLRVFRIVGTHLTRARDVPRAFSQRFAEFPETCVSVASASGLATQPIAKLTATKSVIYRRPGYLCRGQRLARSSAPGMCSRGKRISRARVVVACGRAVFRKASPWSFETSGARRRRRQKGWQVAGARRLHRARDIRARTPRRVESARRFRPGARARTGGVDRGPPSAAADWQRRTRRRGT